MPSTPPKAVDHDAAVKAFTDAVLAFLEEDERSLEWLARKSGVHPSTLRSQLIEKPSRLTYLNSLRISRVVPTVQPLAVAA